MSTENKAVEMKKRLFIGRDDRITAYENNLVTLTLSDGTVHEPLEPRRLFPVNRADEYITLLDKENKEIGIIRALAELDKDSRNAIRASLDDYYLVPHITRIVSISEKYGTLHWCVDTDRGIKEFDIRNRNTDIRVYDDGRVRVRDSDDNRYVIEDFHALDSHSKKLLIVDM
ncbi:MAG: DUF1854 domain-containing protein [Clostridia bacterium]|nr:DUF1854 domain-containing protein [Clostridia bacterium]